MGWRSELIKKGKGGEKGGWEKKMERPGAVGVGLEGGQGNGKARLLRS